MPTYGLTDILIFNKALARLGETLTVTAVDGTDTTKYGVLAGLEFQSTRNEELRGNTWRFAVKRAALVQNTTAANLTGFFYVYDAPDDCLKVLSVYSHQPDLSSFYPGIDAEQSKVSYLYENAYIYCSLDPSGGNPHVRYVPELPLGTVWREPLFADALAMRIAGKIATAVTGEPLSQQARNAMLTEYSALIKRAKDENALEIQDDIAGEGENFWTDRAQWG